jgi:hypothetical protein
MAVAFYFTLLENKHRYLFAEIIFNKRKHYKFPTRHFSCKLWTINGPVDTTWYKCSFTPWTKKQSNQEGYKVSEVGHPSQHGITLQTLNHLKPPIKSTSWDTIYFHLHQVINYSVNQLHLWIPVALSCTLPLYFYITVVNTLSIIFHFGDRSLSKLVKNILSITSLAFW